MIGLSQTSNFQGRLFYLNYNSAHLRETIVSIYPKTWCAQAVDTDFQGTTASLPPLLHIMQGEPNAQLCTKLLLESTLMHDKRK